jgi:transposase InsO family protein
VSVPELIPRAFREDRERDDAALRTDEGSLYLAVILDRCSRSAVGWAKSERITDALTRGALRHGAHVSSVGYGERRRLGCKDLEKISRQRRRRASAAHP